MTIRLRDERSDHKHEAAAPTQDVEIPLDEDLAGAPEVAPSVPEVYDCTFCFPGGLAEYVEFLNAEQDVLHPPIVYGGKYKSDTTQEVELEVAFQYNDGYGELYQLLQLHPDRRGRHPRDRLQVGVDPRHQRLCA